MEKSHITARAGLVVLLLSLAAGCGSGDGGEATVALPTASAPSPSESCDPAVERCTFTDENGGLLTSAYPQSAKVTEMLADNRITREEYETAFSDFEACMADRGYTLIDVDTSSTYIDYAAPVAGDDGDYCYDTHYREVDAFWQIYEEPRLDLVPTLTALIACIESTQASPPGWTIPDQKRAQALLLDEVVQFARDAQDSGTLTHEEWLACTTF